MHATLDLPEAVHNSWDAIVVGAGPAGSIASRELARGGRTVLLVDKTTFPRYKVCGCCLNQRSLQTLATVGLDGLVRRCGARPLHRFALAAGGRRAELPLAQSVSLSRNRLDAALITAAVEAGAEFLPATRAELVALDSDARSVRLTSGGTQRDVVARVVLAADGLGGRLLNQDGGASEEVDCNSHVGAGVIADVDGGVFEAGTIFMSCGSGGYVGLVRLEDDRLDIAAALDPRFVRRCGGLGAAAARIMGEAGLPALDRIEQLAWRGTPLLTRRHPCVAAERVFALGDAAGYVEPFTGEGIAWALAAGVAVAPIADRACAAWEPRLIDQWCDLYQRLVRRRQWLCRLLSMLLRHPAATAQLVHLLSRAPILASPFLISLRCGPAIQSASRVASTEDPI